MDIYLPNYFHIVMRILHSQCLLLHIPYPNRTFMNNNTSSTKSFVSRKNTHIKHVRLFVPMLSFMP